MRAFRTVMIRALEIRHAAYPEGIGDAIEAIEAIDDAHLLEMLLETLLESAIRSNSIEGFTQKL